MFGKSTTHAKLQTKHSLLRAVVALLVWGVLFLQQSGVAWATPLSDAQLNAFKQGEYYFNTEITNSCSGTGTTTLTGADTPTQVWNYFKGQGLDDMHAAAVIGNLKQENGSFNPERVEGNNKHPELPTTTTDPTSLPVVDGWYGGQTRQPGWGIAQWTPSSKIVDIAKTVNITTPIQDLLTQLNIVWAEMDGTTTSPVGYSGNFLTDFKATANITDATEFFRAKFEGGTAGSRLQYAQEFLVRYADTGRLLITTTTTSTTCASVSPDCTSASGTAKILCEAKKYDPISYNLGSGHAGAQTWKSGCPVINASCTLDCSGLVNIAVYDAFGVDLNEDTTKERADAAAGKYWKQIPSSEVQPGDIVQPNSGHVEIVDHIEGTVLYSFGARTNSGPQSDNVGGGHPFGNYSSSYVFYRYIGPGA